MRRWLRPLWIFLALLFLLEAWLWDHLAPIVARVVNLIPWARFKLWLAHAISGLPPWATLFVFLVPLIALLPLKFLESICSPPATGSARFCSSYSRSWFGVGVTRLHL